MRIIKAADYQDMSRKAANLISVSYTHLDVYKRQEHRLSKKLKH